MAAYVILISLFLMEAVVGENLLQPTRKCVPTATIRAPCHECVCHIDGVYHCTRKACPQALEIPDPNLRECEPNELYRENTTFCSCAPSGYWRSINCREHFNRLPLKKDPIRKNMRTNIACHPNTLYITDCNVCVCTPSGIIDFSSCTTRPCPKRFKGDYCEPGDVYRTSNEYCACSNLNYYLDRLCIRVVDEVVQPVGTEDIARVIDIGAYWKIDENACIGNISFTKDCNTCTCVDGQFHCTRLICYNDYTGLRTDNAKQPLMLELKSEDDICIPGRKYKLKCNTCLCNRKGEPLCTSMICLEDLVADRAMLRQRIVSY